jgi:hypothetical protein
MAFKKFGYTAIAPLLAAVAGVGLLGCNEKGPFESIELFPRSPIVSVVVYTFPWYVQVGDTLHVSAEGFGANGYTANESLRSVAWQSAPSGRVALEVLPSPFQPRSARVVRGLAPGRANLTATLNGVSGSDSVVVLPRLQAIELSADRTTAQVGETVTISALIRTTEGATLEGPYLIWESSDYTRAGFTFGEGLVVARGAGTVEITATIARMTGRITLTILPAATP